MKKIEISFSPYELKFAKPFETAKGTVASRKGFIIKAKNDKRIISAGDASPFPEFGTETYAQAESYLNNFNHPLNLDINNFELSFQKNFADMEGYPALRCGLEQALLTLISEEQKVSINHILNTESRSPVKVNAVIPLAAPVKSAALAEEYIDEGYSTLKLKAGRKDFSTDLQCIEKITSAVGNKIKLRIDVNGSWNLTEAVNNLKQLYDFNIEYVEQPVNSIEDYCELVKNTKIPLAADESIRTLKEAVDFIRSGSIKYIVLKPMMIGGITPLLSIYEEAKTRGVKVVVTSSFESGIGFQYAVFAASLIRDDIAHGLATQHYFETKILPEIYSIKNGVIHL